MATGSTVNGSDKNRDNKRDALRLANLSSIGIALVLCIFIGYGMGYYLDKYFHSTPVCTLIFLLLGIAAGFINVFKAISDNSK